MVKKILLGLLVLFIAIQFIRQSKNLGASPGPADLFAQHQAPDDVKQLVQTACYDCHSNTTRYPWYAEVQPVGWFLADHIKEGKRHLNFSGFGQLPPKRAARKLEQCADEVSEGGMPLASYRLVHADARLTDAQRKLLVAWFDSVRAQLPPAEAAK
jgi:uncharacterized membrane protein